MNYILYGEQSPQIKTRLKKILKDRLGDVDEFNAVKVDYEETDINEIIDEMSILPLGYDRKVLIIDNAHFIENGGNKDDLKKITEALHDDEAIDVIFISHVENILKSIDLVKEIEANGQIFQFMNITKADWPKVVKKYFVDHGASIDNDAVEEMVVRCDGDLQRFINEANKLMLYKDHITLVDVTLMVAKPIEDDVFQISNALFRGDNAAAIDIYRDLQKLGSRATDTLLPMLGNQFRFISQVGFLYEKGLDVSEIAQELKANEYRVKISLGNYRKLSRARIARALDTLYNLDVKIKSGQIDRFYGFELFLINFPN